jgi:hypothetical protein
VIHKTICLCVLLTFIVPAAAGAALTQTEVFRLTKAKALLMDAEKRPLDEIIEEFERTGLPHEHLQIYEAVAATFRDILTDHQENDTRSRERLLDKIRMNMAYFQFGGTKTEQEGGSELNRLIQRKLKQYLPEDIWGNSKLFHSLE